MEKNVKYLKEIYKSCTDNPDACQTKTRDFLDFEDREKLAKFDQKELVEYMVENGADCEWGLIPELKKQFNLK